MDAYRGGGPASPAELAALAEVPEGAPADELLPRAPRAQRPRRLDLAAGAGRGHAPPRPGSGGRLRRGELLRDVLHDAAAARPSRTSATTCPAGWRAPSSGSPRCGRPSARPARRATTPCGSRARASASATSPRPRWSTAARSRRPTAAPSTDALRGAVAARRALGGPAAGRARRPGLTSRRRARRRFSDASSRASTPWISMPTRPTGASSGSARPGRLGPRGVLAALKASRLAGRGGAAFPAATKWEAVAQHPVAAPLRGRQRGRVRDRHLQGSDPRRVGSLRGPRGRGHRRLHVRGRAGLHLHPRRVPPRLRPAPGGDPGGGPPERLRRGAGRTGPASRSSSGAAPAPTSAARRPRSSTRSRGSGASRAPSPPSRSTTASSASPP